MNYQMFLLCRCFYCADVNVIVKFSQYEFQYGDVERGKTMLESVLRNYPKRVDIWSVYIDLLIKQEDFNHVRYSYMFTLAGGLFTYSVGTHARNLAQMLNFALKKSMVMVRPVLSCRAFSL